MTLNKIILSVALAAALFSGCAKNNADNQKNGDNSVQNAPGSVSLPSLSGANVLPLTVNGAQCSSSTQYLNKPCVSVTICQPGTNNCQTINDILLDTGSFGLRVFSSVVSVPLTQINNAAGKAIVECAQFGSGSDWGPVKLADVVLGGEPVVQVPIQVIDSTYAKYPASCGTPDTSPSDAGFNGILGVGLFKADCGSHCATQANNGSYYGCTGTTCAGTVVSLASQVQNPVGSLPTDNNGVIVELPGVPLGGVAAANGYVVLGIGTQSNNTPSGVKAYSADSSTGDFSTTFNGKTYSGFLDSGSNAFFFTPPSSLSNCGGGNSEWFCPPSTQNFSATNIASSGTPTSPVSFSIGNFEALFATPSFVFVEVGGTGSDFDLGLPFYFGHNIYVGLEGTKSTLGTGPYWAY